MGSTMRNTHATNQSPFKIALAKNVAFPFQNTQTRHEAQMNELKDRLAAEIRKQKTEWTQREKVQREKWMKEQKEEILQTTAKAGILF